MTTEVGFRFAEALGDSDGVRFARGVSARDGGAVLLQQFRRSPTHADIARLDDELALLRSLDELPGVARARDIVVLHGDPALLLDDPGGQPLDREVAAAPVALDQKLDLAVRLAGIVGSVHQRGVVHRGLRPSGILWNRQQGRVVLLDFSAATRATRDIPSGAIVGAPAYLSPEQTGRLGAIVDRRSDLYALGATLYWLFTGRPPFDGTDLPSLLHAHVARLPERADHVTPDVPAVVASILDKLLRKDPDDRYQTARGLEADLRRVCAGDRAFSLGADDAPSVLRVRDTLVGRGAEVQQLDALVASLAAGQRAIAYLSGEAGVGKSALLRALARSVVASGGLYARGKFDLAVGAKPYHSITQILSDLTSALLSLPGARLERLRDTLASAMDALAPALVDVFPAVRPLFRDVAPLATVPTVESRNRLVASFVTFVATIASSERMIVLVVDDLQWADGATLGLLDALARDAATSRVALVVAARDDEVLPGSPVARFLTSLKDATRVRVAPLSHDAVAAILADSLHATPERVDRLAHVVWTKTQGNPFVLRTLLESAIARGFVRYEAGFVWDDDAIDRSPLAEDVATLLAGKLADLPDATRDALAVAARVGDPVDASLVASALSTPDAQVREAELLERLSPAIEAGLLCRAGSAIQFAHDRLIEAALALEPDAPSIHARLSAVMLDGAHEDRFFEGVDHLWSSGAPDHDTSRARCASLALDAARRAYATRAFDAAERYFERWAATDARDAFDARFTETFDAHLQWAEAAYLAGRYDRAEALFADLDGRARTAAERLRVRRILINYYEKTYRFVDAIRLSFSTLSDVGVVLPSYEDITADDVGAEIGRFLERLAKTDRAHPARLPLCESSVVRDAIAMLVAVAVPLWSARPEALPLVLARAGILSLDEGLAPASGAGLVLLGSMLCLALDASDAGIETAGLGLAAQNRAGDPDYECQCLFGYHTMVQFHHESAALGRAGLLTGFQRGVAVGNRQWASYCADQYPLRGTLIGLPLPKVAEDVREIEPALLRLEQEDSITHAEAQKHFVERILEQEESAWNLGARRTDGATALQYLRDSKHRGPILLHSTFRILECLVRGELDEAHAIVASEGEALFQPTGQLQSEFAAALVALTLARAAPSDDAAADARIASVERRFARLARFEATSFGGYHALVDGARLERAGAFDAAADAYDRAIDVFERDAVLHLLGLAHEGAARVHEAAGRRRTARFYRTAARDTYARWGAPAAVRRLERELGAYARRGRDDADGAAARADAHEPVDVVSLMKATRAIASEIEVDRLIPTLLAIVAENAGASRAHLFLDRDGDLALEARCGADLEVHRARPEERDDAACAPLSVAHQAARAREIVTFDDASAVPQAAADPYLASRGHVAVLAAPIERHGRVAGVVVVENDLVRGAFTRRHAEIVASLNAQIAVALETAALYDELRARAASLAESNDRLRAEVRERERAEQALVESESKLRQAQKMEAIGQLAGGIAHDFNNLLTVISICTEMTLHDLGPDAPCARYVADIRQAGESAAALTRQLLAFSRRQVVAPRQLSLGTVLRELLPLVRRMLVTHVRLEFGCDDAFDIISADRGQLEQVVLNLVVNARDAMPDGGVVRVDVLGAPPGERSVRLRVRDAGIGMDEATRARIFEPFFTTKPVGRGTGLGLSTVYGIVTESGGTIDVASTPGAGTTFEIAFPAVRAERVDPARVDAAPRGAGQRVLVVEDDPSIQSLAAGILSTHGYDVHVAGDADDALRVHERLERGGQPVDLVLTDLLMPGVDGRTLGERLLRLRPSLRVMYMSGFTNDAFFHHLAKTGEVAILAKPFTPTSLLEGVHRELTRPTRSVPPLPAERSSAPPSERAPSSTDLRRR